MTISKIAARTSTLALALMCCLPIMALANKPVTKIDNDCGCTSPYRTYDKAPTAIQQSLFKAAHVADVDTFMRLLPMASALCDVAVDDEPILSAIIRPDPELKSSSSLFNFS